MQNVQTEKRCYNDIKMTLGPESVLKRHLKTSTLHSTNKYSHVMKLKMDSFLRITLYACESSPTFLHYFSHIVTRQHEICTQFVQVPARPSWLSAALRKINSLVVRYNVAIIHPGIGHVMPPLFVQQFHCRSVPPRRHLGPQSITAGSSGWAT